MRLQEGSQTPAEVAGYEWHGRCNRLHQKITGDEATQMKINNSVSWIAQQYCSSIASALLARKEFFELMEDATVSSARLARARATWQQHARHAQAIKGLATA
jgi:major membrane immunogen (membrane-anchored lipoprotein)